jgi:NAD(P)-dependent dehydrogenase (short-subunit alcohol dehydrogenase family)
MPLLERGQARIINLSSEAHKMGKPEFGDLQAEHGYSAIRRLMVRLSCLISTSPNPWPSGIKAKGITAFALHPGMVKHGSFGPGLNGLD